MKVIRTTMRGKTQKEKAISIEKAVAELLPSHPNNTLEQIKKAVLKGVKLQGPQGSFYQLEAGYQGAHGEYKDSESKKKRKKEGKVVKPETDENIVTPEGLAKECDSTAFNVRKAIRGLKLKRTGKYWVWNRAEDAETITNIIAAVKKAELKPTPKPKKKEAVVGGEEGPLGPPVVEDLEEEEEEEEEDE